MKKQQKLTDWIDPEVKPIIKGWYERDYGHEQINKDFDYWDGKKWWYGTGRGKKSGLVLIHERRWRGLAENPGKAKE